MSKCRVCRGPAIIDVPRHNAHFCAEHLQQLCRRQVEKAIGEHAMLAPGDRVLVAVSGGKDSLAVWDLLLELGYQADGLYVGLGIGDYSEASGEYARAFAAARGLDLRTIQSPYNTYAVPGLPPGPIANPGLESILAAANPATTDFYYYRALCDGSGRHAAHTAASRRYVASTLQLEYASKSTQPRSRPGIAARCTTTSASATTGSSASTRRSS